MPLETTQNRLGEQELRVGNLADNMEQIRKW